MEKTDFIEACRALIAAFENGDLGQSVMPEGSHPEFNDQESRLAYFTLPMALNYQRDSYKLWQAALKTWQDPETRWVFDVKKESQSEESTREALTKYKLALQPNKHINTWIRISDTIYNNWGSFENLINAADNDFLRLKQIIQIDHKAGFPYLSGPKIFNYWAFILTTYGNVDLINREYIDIAPDTHITKCSVKLGVITPQEADQLTKDQISTKWRELLQGSDIDPIDMHAPLWFWSRNGFIFEV